MNIEGATVEQVIEKVAETIAAIRALDDPEEEHYKEDDLVRRIAYLFGPPAVVAALEELRTDENRIRWYA